MCSWQYVVSKSVCFVQDEVQVNEKEMADIASQYGFAGYV